MQVAWDLCFTFLNFYTWFVGDISQPQIKVNKTLVEGSRFLSLFQTD